MSQTASIRSTVAVRKGTNCRDKYSANVAALVRCTMWMIAAMSSTSTVSCMAVLVQSVGTLTHVRMSDLVPALSELWYDREGGSRWFSNLKNSAISASVCD